MHLRLLSIFAAMLLVAACETTQENTGESAGTGASSEDASTATSTVTSETSDTEDGTDEIVVVQSDEDEFGPTQDGLIAFAGDRVFFDYDKYNINAEGQRTLERQAEWLAKYSNVSITIEGHCDERGTREYNLALGERRAQAAKSYLIALRVDSGRLTTVSYGKERPDALGSNEAAWSQNRRSVSIVN